MTKILHSDNCDWHFDQYPWECTCGVTGPKAGDMNRTTRLETVESIKARIAEAKKPYRAPKPDRPDCSIVIGRNGVAVAVMSDATPTPERIQHSQEISPTTGKVYGGTERVQTRDEETGEVRHPLRIKDDIDRMVEKGQITNDEAKIARKFRDEFEIAGHDPLKAADPARQPGGKGSSPGVRIQIAKDYVWECLERMGPRGCPTRIAFWWVIGAGCSHREAAQRIGPWTSGQAVAGLIIAGLNVLATQKG